MLPPKRIAIVAGEESGDLHAAAFVRQLKIKYPDVEIAGIGGKHMEKAGVHLLHNLARISVTGTSEIFRHLRVFIRAFNDMKVHLEVIKPDLLILVDYPEFNLRLAKFAKRKLGIKIIYYISPQIWAWKPGRIELIRECVDHMAVILPFEKELYENAGVPVSFVGHPLVEKIESCKKQNIPREALGLPDNKRVVAMLPGSRGNEIERHMPILVESAKMLSTQFDDLHFVIPIASTIKPDLIKTYFKNASISYTLIQGKALETVACSDCVVVASGTASLECALLEKPMCIIYKASFLTYLMATLVIKVKYLGLCNLLQNKMIVPELLQYDCTAEELTRVITTLLSDANAAAQMQTRLQKLSASLAIEKSDASLYELIEEELEVL